jgi:hypothetical protein
MLSCLIPLHAWHPLHAATHPHILNNWVADDRVVKSSAEKSDTINTSTTHHHNVIQTGAHKTAS